jgi:hypothetical protein
MSSGLVYVLSNSAMPGLIKIGFTTRSIMERIDELSHTGVPAKFEMEIEVSTSDPEMLEKRLHIAFSRYHYKKEFFKCDLEVATKLIKNHLASSNIEFHYIRGRAAKKYLTEQEKHEIEEAKITRARLEEEKRAEEVKKEREVYEIAKMYEPKFSQLLDTVNKTFIARQIEYENSLTSKFLNRSALWDVGAAFATLGVSLLPSAILSSGLDFPDGKFIAKKYSKREIDDLDEFYRLVKAARVETESDPRFEVRDPVLKLLKINFDKGRKEGDYDRILQYYFEDTDAWDAQSRRIRKYSHVWFKKDPIDLLQKLNIFDL